MGQERAGAEWQSSNNSRYNAAECRKISVCSALGIDTSDYSFPYVASWASGKELKELKDSMDTIRLTAADFLEKLETAVAERSVERMTAMEYAEKLIADKERDKTVFDNSQRNLIVNFAYKLDDRAATEELANNLAAAVAAENTEEINRLMWEAEEKIESLPDGMIGLSEMHEYGYLKDDVLPLTKEGAREWHRLGERIYPLFQDGTAGDFASREEIEQHDGIFGIKADAWSAILLEKNEDYLEDEYSRPDAALTVISREQALRLFDEGKQIYLIRISPWPVLVTGREEIERGSDYFQMFKEKPTQEVAKDYIAKGALWNGGVFAFKLGYVLNRAHELIDFVDYEDLFNKYDTLNKISFDYAVVEHEPEIEVMRFAGTWKDLGTWNTLTEAMDSHAVGEALFNENCENVHVVNELDVPILCMGLKDVVVSASPEGILVSDKEQSSYIKPFVNTLDHRVMFAEKSWGSFKVIDIDSASMTIKVTLNAGHRMNYHSHQHRDEVWTVIAGKGKTIVDGMEQNVKAGDVITMSAGCRHTVIAETELKLIEVQLGEAIDVHDKQKFELEY